MSTDSSTVVVAGVDGSDDSLDALDVAVDEAVLRGCPLLVAHAREASAQTPEAVIEQAADHARQRSDRVRVRTCEADEEPGPYLTGLGRDAALLVVGSRGLHGFAGLLAGSVSLYIAGHAACPVMVVRGGSAALPAPESPGTVVVGVDPGGPVPEAVGFAFAEAALRDVGVDLLVAAPGPVETARATAEQAARPWRERYPRVRARIDVVGLRPAYALVAASEEAGLLVVGTRARHSHLAHVDHAVVHHAFSPVVLVPAGWTP